MFVSVSPEPVSSTTLTLIIQQKLPLCVGVSCLREFLTQGGKRLVLSCSPVGNHTHTCARTHTPYFGVSWQLRYFGHIKGIVGNYRLKCVPTDLIRI